MLGYSPPPSSPPAFPPPLTFDIVNTIAVSAETLASTTPSSFAAAVLATVSTQVADSSAQTQVTVLVQEEQELEMDSGDYALTDAYGNPNVFNQGAFLTSIKEAACADMIGSCLAVFADERRRGLVLTADAPPSGNGDERGDENEPQTTMPMRRRKLARRRVSLSRSYDATSANANTDVGQLVASAMADKGVAVTASRVTALSAESTVTTVGDPTGTAAVTDALADDALGAALAQTLPAVSLDIVTTVVAPPSTPPMPLPPPPAPPGAPGAPPIEPSLPPPPYAPPSVPINLTLVIAITVVALADVALLLWCLRRRRVRQQKKEYPSADAMSGVVPGTSSRRAAAARAANARGFPSHSRPSPGVSPLSSPHASVQRLMGRLGGPSVVQVRVLPRASDGTRRLEVVDPSEGGGGGGSLSSSTALTLHGAATAGRSEVTSVVMPPEMNVAVGDVLELSDDDEGSGTGIAQSPEPRPRLMGLRGQQAASSRSAPVKHQQQASSRLQPPQRPQPPPQPPPQPRPLRPAPRPRSGRRSLAGASLASALPPDPPMQHNYPPSSRRAPGTPPLPESALRGVPLSSRVEAQWQARAQVDVAAARAAAASGQAMNDPVASVEANRVSAGSVLKALVESDQAAPRSTRNVSRPTRSRGAESSTSSAPAGAEDTYSLPSRPSSRGSAFRPSWPLSRPLSGDANRARASAMLSRNSRAPMQVMPPSMHRRPPPAPQPAFAASASARHEPSSPQAPPPAP